MLGIRLVRLIERHSEALSRGLTEHILKSDRTSDFREIPQKDLRLAATEVYGNLGDWLLQKTDSDIEKRFRAAAMRRAAEGIRLHQFVWALMLSRDHLWRFLSREGFADTIVELHAQMELLQLLNQFFDRAVFYAIVGYDEAPKQSPNDDVAKAKEWAISVGLMSRAPETARSWED